MNSSNFIPLNSDLNSKIKYNIKLDYIKQHLYQNYFTILKVP